MIKKNLVVFDIDGTLTDSVLIHQEAFIKSLLKLGVPKQNPEKQPRLNSFKHHTDSFIAKALFEQYTDIPFDHLLLQKFESELYQYIQKSQINEIKGAINFINYLTSETNYGICFATGSLYRPAVHKLNAIGIQFNETLLVASDNIGDRESIINQAIHQAKVFYDQTHFNHIISIGDGIWDLKAAKNLNLDFIGIGTQHKDTFIKNHVNWIADDFTQLNFSEVLRTTQS